MTDVRVYLPRGRFVSGSMTDPQTKDARGVDIPVDKQRKSFGIAISKTDPATAKFFGDLHQGARQAFSGKPHEAGALPLIDAWFNTMQGFSMKVSDGDKANLTTGKVNENTAGHFVVWFSTGADHLVRTVNTTPHGLEQVDPSLIKRGFYVDASCGIVANDNPPHDRIGIYMNPVQVRFIAEGPLIGGGPSMEQVNSEMPEVAPSVLPGAANAPMPPVQQQPVAPPAPPMPGQAAPGQPPAPVTPPAPPAGGGMPGTPQQPGATGSPGSTPPYPGIMPNQGQ